jgi:hypothetical protein
MAKKAPKKTPKKAAKKPVAKPKKTPKPKPVMKAKPPKAKFAPSKKTRPAPKKAKPAEKKTPKKAAMSLPPSQKMELLPSPKPESLLTYERPKVEFPEIKPIPLPKEPKSAPEPKREPEIKPIMPAERMTPPEIKPILQAPEPVKPQPPAIRPEPQIRPEPIKPAINTQAIFEPELDLLPVWEDRLRLKRMIFEDALVFSSPEKDSPDYAESRLTLEKTMRKGFRDVPGYFLVCIKDKDGKVVAAMDGHFINDILVILRSGVSGQRKRELHVLLYSAAMSGKNMKYVVFAAERKPLDANYAGELILLGRGFGMSAFVAEKLLFVRRMKKELDPLSNGPEVSKLLDSMVPFIPELGKMVLEFSAKNIVALSPLPTSPDSREHLHELRDSAEALGLVPEDMDALVEDLKQRYVYGRQDITPALL